MDSKVFVLCHIVSKVIINEIFYIKNNVVNQFFADFNKSFSEYRKLFLSVII